MLLPLAVGLLDSQGQDMRLTSVKDGTSLHNLTSSDGSYVTTAVLHVDKVNSWSLFNCALDGLDSLQHGTRLIYTKNQSSSGNNSEMYGIFQCAWYVRCEKLQFCIIYLQRGI